MKAVYNAHGGNLDDIQRRYNIPKHEIIDFSGNINSLGAPESVLQAIRDNILSVSAYPDITYAELRDSIARYTGAPSEHIIVGNGSTELISILIKTIQPKKAIIVSPAYSEYEREVKLSGGVCDYFSLREDEDFEINLECLLSALDSTADLLIICNPNNPTGRAIDNKNLTRILTRCAENHTFVMVDETYVEFAEATDISSVPLTLRFNNLITLRGTSKFFAVPGLRLGYGICSDGEVLAGMNRVKDPWSVNVLAVAAGCAMFRDDSFINETKRLIFTERRKFFQELNTWTTIKTYPSQSNFILVKILLDSKTAGQVFEELLQYRLLIRDCTDYQFLGEKFLRFCVLRPEHNETLIRSLKEVLT